VNTVDLDVALTIIDRDGRALVAAAQANPTAEVAACPGWSTADLAIHTTSVQRRVAHWCTIRAAEPVRWPDHEPADPAAPWDWCRQGLALVIEALRDIDPDEPVWSWTDRRTGGFYHRRMLHETVMHRWDAEAATGTPSHIPDAVAADGIDEITEVGMRFRGDGSPVDYPDGHLLLVANDGPGRWLLRSVDGTLMVGRNGDAGDRADATITGPTEDLLLHLWGRPTGPVAIAGDPDVATVWATIAP
jgi:uncharacterized protein (TIGR03083 family)